MPSRENKQNIEAERYGFEETGKSYLLDDEQVLDSNPIKDNKLYSDGLPIAPIKEYGKLHYDRS
jgi:hypothetical protein